MNTRAFTLAIVIALVAMFMAYSYIEEQKSKIINAYGKEVPVVVAKRDIKELELIDDSKIEIKKVPKSFMAPGRFSRIEDLINTVAVTPISKGEQITKPRITYPGIKSGLSRQVKVGMRAISITINEQSGVSRLIKPGDRVDVLAPVDFSSGQKQHQSIKTILQDVIVLSVGKKMTDSLPMSGVKIGKEIKTMKLNVYERYNTVTLELSPYQVQKMYFILSYSGGRPFLSLRNNNDTGSVRIKSTRIFDILGHGSNDDIEAKKYFDKKNRKNTGKGRR